MSRLAVSRGVLLLGALAALALAGLSRGRPGSAAPPQSAREAPLLLDFQQGARAELVGISFVREVVDTDGSRHMNVSEERLDQFRLAVATIRITKRAGAQLTLACADLTLHYYHGDDAEVTPCEGLSSFTTALDTDREITLSSEDGPGFLKKSTPPRATGAEVIYIDAVFAGMEPDTREAWIAVGQVIDRQRPFTSTGWRS